ncbi:MAG TPA: hypothetical protein PK823_16555 [Novosphingobium sp.]|nr:hypothetical protein [Novosphingobium sp.]
MTRDEARILAREAQSALRIGRINELADRVAEGATIRAAADAMGIGQSTALEYWAQIKRGLGWQAV